MTVQTFFDDRKTLCATLSKELNSNISQPLLTPYDEEATLCTVRGFYFDTNNDIYDFSLQIPYFHDINHVPHGFGVPNIYVSGDREYHDDETPIEYANKLLRDDLKAHWGEVHELGDPAEVARLCAQSIKYRIEHKAFDNPAFC